MKCQADIMIRLIISAIIIDCNDLLIRENNDRVHVDAEIKPLRSARESSIQWLTVNRVSFSF
jgi:hypothetical protein